MQELLQAVLEDTSARTSTGASAVASQAAADFAPWATGEEV